MDYGFQPSGIRNLRSGIPPSPPSRIGPERWLLDASGGSVQAFGVYSAPLRESSRRFAALIPSGSESRLPSYSMPT